MKTLVKTHNQRILSTAEKIMQRLNISLLEHHTQVFEMGEQYLLTLGDKESVFYRYFINNKSYWNWFRIEYEMYERWFLINSKTMINLHVAGKKLYQSFMQNYIIENRDVAVSFDTFVKIHTVKTNCNSSHSSSQPTC